MNAKSNRKDYPSIRPEVADAQYPNRFYAILKLPARDVAAAVILQGRRFAEKHGLDIVGKWDEVIEHEGRRFHQRTYWGKKRAD